MTSTPPIRLIANLVVHDGAGQILLARYDAGGELDEPGAA